MEFPQDNLVFGEVISRNDRGPTGGFLRLRRYRMGKGVPRSPFRTVVMTFVVDVALAGMGV
jgi:hypothetical protein